MHQRDIDRIEKEYGKKIVEINPPVSDSGETWNYFRFEGERKFRKYYHDKQTVSGAWF